MRPAALSLFFTRFNIAITSLLSLSLSLLLTACQPVNFEADNDAQTQRPILRIYNWVEYMPQQIIDNFEKETGIEVIYDTYDSNEQMYNRITQSVANSARSVSDTSTGNQAPYDLVIPSSYFVDRMRHEDLLHPIDKSKLNNFSQLNPKTLDTFIDPNNNYSIPYLWGTTGIAIDSQAIDPNTVNRWQDLWRPEFKGRLLLSNDMREVFGMALLSLGYSINSENPEEIRQAYEKLLKLLPNVAVMESEFSRSGYMTDRADIGMIWSGEIMLAQKQGMDYLTYKYPNEGAILWIDSLVIPKNAQNIEAAYRFINFILRSENARIISRQTGYATPNLGARLFMTPSEIANTTIYPTQEQFNNAELHTAISADALKIYEFYWNKLLERSKQLETEQTAITTSAK